MVLKKTRLSQAVVLALSAGTFGLGAATGAWAQQAEPQRIEITGSSIKRLATEGALPVQTFSQEDIKRSGVTSVTDFIQSIPAMQGFTSIGDSVGGGGGGITTASLHDVGEQYTLVLLNGRRVAPATSGTTIDLNSIPLAAIERIEVLTDGASALYGADAIAGVVNFILKSGASPLTIDVRHAATEHGGGEESNASISKGWGELGRDGYSLFVSASFDTQKQLKSKDREFAKTGLLSGTFGNLAYDFFNGSSRSVPPNVDVKYNDFTKPPLPSGAPATSTTSLSPYFLANGVCPPDHVNLGRQCFFDYTSTVEIAPERERMSVFGSGKLALGKSGWTAFGDLALTDVSTKPRIAPYPAEFSMALSHPYYAQYIQPYLTPVQDANAVSVNVKYRLYDMGNRAYDYNTKSMHGVAGLQGAAGAWDLTTALTYSVQKQDQNYLGGFPLAAAFNAALNSQAVDPFPYTLGTMPAAQLAALKATQYIGNYNTTDIKMVAWDGNAQRPVFKMGGGDAVLSLGMDARKTGYQVTANQAVAHSEILFDDDQPEFDLSRKSLGVYSEMLLPVSKTIDLTAAVRFDSISGTTDHKTGIEYGQKESATTFKLAGKYQASKDLLFRASYGTGFRTATMREIAQPKIDFGVTSGTYACPFNAGYDPLGYIAAGHTCANGLQFEVFQGGNPNLKPEKSNQWNLGMVWQATNEFSLGMNYWSVEISDAVSSVSENLIMTQPAKYLGLFTTKFKASNGQTYVAILDAPTNIGKAVNAGIDWDLNYRGRASFGTVKGSLSGTYLVRSAYTIAGTDNQWTTSMSQFGVNDAVSFRNVIVASGTVGMGNWEHTLTAKYRSGYQDQFYSAADWCFFYDPVTFDCADGRLSVPDYVTFDWRTQWTATKNLTLVVGVQNLLDETPPLSLRVNGAGHQLGYDPRYASPYGRTFTFNANWKF